MTRYKSTNNTWIICELNIPIYIKQHIPKNAPNVKVIFTD